MSKSNTDTSTTQRRYLSESEVSAMTGIARRTLQKWRLFGRHLPFYRAGGAVRYSADEVEQFMRAGRVEAR